MENGDRRKISQRRLLGVHPDHLDSRRRIVARSRGSDVPAAVHVSGSGGWVRVGGGLVRETTLRFLAPFGSYGLRVSCSSYTVYLLPLYNLVAVLAITSM